MVTGPPHTVEQVLADIRSHLGGTTPSYAQFLNLTEQLLLPIDSHHFDEVILGIARLLKALPTAFYRLNPLFYPRARVEFNIHQSPITSLVLKTPDSSRIVVLDSQNSASCAFDNLSIFELRDILANRTAEDQIYDDIHNIADPALRDCLAQLVQDLLDEPDLSKAHRKEVLRFLRRLGGVPPSLLLYELKELELFAQTIISDLKTGLLAGSKVIIKNHRISKEMLDNSEILREVILCRQLRHPNILPFVGVTFDSRNRLGTLVTPYMRHGNILEFLQCYPNIDRLTPIWQIMKGLEYLHTFQPPFPHRSIKGTNVLVNNNLTCCLSDFGLSFIPELAQRSRDHAVSTMPWMAPEVLAPPETGQVDLLQIDVFALGIAVHEIFTGSPPLSDLGFFAIYTSRIVRKEIPPFPQDCPFPVPAFLPELVGMMLDHDPDRRPPIRMLCQGFEDSFLFPKEIRISGVDGTNASDKPDNSSTLQMGQEWVRREREQIQRMSIQAKSTPTRAQSLRRTKILRTTTAPPPQPVIVAPRPFHAVSPLSGLDSPTFTGQPFSRAVMSPLPPGHTETPSFAALTQGSPSNPLTPPESPHGASTTLRPRSVQNAPSCSQYTESLSRLKIVSSDPMEPTDMTNQSRENLQQYCRSEGSPASPPPSPAMIPSSTISPSTKGSRAPSAC